MKRLSLILASSILLAGCATAPAPHSPTLPTSRTQPTTNYPGQTQPLPRQQAPVYSSGNQQTPANPNQGNAADNQAPQGSAGAASSPQPAPPQTAEQASSPAVMSLLRRADTLAGNGNMDDAAATLERALDLAPRNPFVYQRLAAVRLADGQAGQAEQLAKKSNSVAGNNPFVEAGNWRLIAEARKSTGDSQGEQAARAQAVSLRQSASQYGQ